MIPNDVKPKNTMEEDIFLLAKGRYGPEIIFDSNKMALTTLLSIHIGVWQTGPAFLAVSTDKMPGLLESMSKCHGVLCYHLINALWMLANDFTGRETKQKDFLLTLATTDNADDRFDAIWNEVVMARIHTGETVHIRLPEIDQEVKRYLEMYASKVSLTFPAAAVYSFNEDRRQYDGDKMWGEEFFEKFRLDKITRPVDQVWCEKLRCSDNVVARSMVYGRTDFTLA